MKAKDLVKKPTDLKQIYKQIEDCNSFGDYKIFIPHHKNFSESARIQLIEDGFKVYKGDWDGIMKDVYIIEW